MTSGCTGVNDKSAPVQADQQAPDPEFKFMDLTQGEFDELSG
jgi:hypothetical protein